MRRFLALAALWVLLAACTDGGATEPGSTSTPSATASASGSPSASASAVAPPVLPEVAKEHTKAGSKAFIRHFWDVANYAQDTLDVEPMRGLVTDACRPCHAAIQAVERTKREGGRSSGGENRPHSIRVKRYSAGDLRYDIVAFTVDVAEMRTDYPDDTKDTVQAATSGRLRFTLVAIQEGGWLVDGWEVAG